MVLFGADSSHLMVMDPMPNAGLVKLSASHLMKLPRGRAVLGMPLLGDLLRQHAGVPSLAQALQGAR